MASLFHKKADNENISAWQGKDPTTKSDEFLEKFQKAFDPPPPDFWKIMLQFFYNGYGCIYARMHRPDSIS